MLERRWTAFAPAAVVFAVIGLPDAGFAQITSLTPSLIGAGTQPSITFTGAAPSATTSVAFATSTCAIGRVGVTALPVSDTAVLGAPLSAGAYLVCYTTDGSTWLQQAAVTLTVVQATPSSITAVAPSPIYVDSQPSMTFTGAVPSSTTLVAFAPVDCSSGRVGVTPLPVSDTAVLGTPISAIGSYKVCYTVDNGAIWAEQAVVTLSVIHPPCAVGEYDAGPACQSCGNGGASYDCGSEAYQTGVACDGTGTSDTQTCASCTTCSASEYEALSCDQTHDRSCQPCDGSCATCTGPTATDCSTCPLGPVDPSGYCVSPGTCAPVPVSCATAAKGVLLLRDHPTASRRKLVWKWSRGESAVTQEDFGDPVGTTDGFQLCVYGDVGGGESLIASATIPGGATCGGEPCWSAVATKGWNYTSADGAADGIRKLRLRGGAAGRPRVTVVGKGAALQLSPPLDGTRYVDDATPVTAQLRSADPAICWSSTFDAVSFRVNDGRKLKAKTP